MTYKVFVVNAGGHNYSDAERFGEIVFCTHGAVDRFDINQMYRECAEAMKDAVEEDYILITSLSSLCSIARAIHAAKFKQLHLLLYRDGQYTAKSLMFNNSSTKDSQLDFPETSLR